LRIIGEVFEGLFGELHEIPITSRGGALRKTGVINPESVVEVKKNYTHDRKPKPHTPLIIGFF